MNKINYERELNDLAKLIASIVFPILIISIIIFIYSKEIISLILNNSGLDTNNVILITPFEGLTTMFNLSFGISIVACIPLILISVYAYLRPLGLKVRGIYLYIIFSNILGVIGFCLGTLILPKYLFSFLIKNYTFATPMWSLQEVFSLIINLGIIGAFAFQIIILILLVNKMGLVSIEFLKDFRVRSGVLLALLLISAWLTPPDLFSMFAVAIPTYLLYEIGLFLTKFQGRKKCLEQQR